VDAKSLLVCAAYFLLFVPPSYWVLKKSGVTQKLTGRAVKFGFSIAAFQVILPIACTFIGFEHGSTIGSILGLGLSYLYVKNVLILKWYNTVAIVFLLPVVAGLLVNPVIYTWFSITSA
jgi:phosphate/sulfate permease